MTEQENERFRQGRNSKEAVCFAQVTSSVPAAPVSEHLGHSPFGDVVCILDFLMLWSCLAVTQPGGPIFLKSFLVIDLGT